MQRLRAAYCFKPRSSHVSFVGPKYLLFMKLLLILVFCFLPLLALGNDSPVVVELFTSEGCSSCPPADALLLNFDRSQPIAGAQLIVLSEHVTYWNHGGWVDAYSSPQFTDRQAAYVKRFGIDSSYTPQMVVDGSSQFVGSDYAKAKRACEKSSAEPKMRMRLDSPKFLGDKLATRIEVDEMPESPGPGDAEVYVALVTRRTDSQVAHGENSGRHLSHVNVVRSLTKVGRIERGKNFSRKLEVKLPVGVDLANVRLISFVQQPGPGRILGAAISDAVR